MATITLAQIRTAAQNQGAFKTTDTRLTSAAWTDIINRALRQIVLEHDWYWLRSSETLTLTAGTATVAPGSTAFLRTLSLTHTDVGTPLSLRDVTELDRITQSGRPVLYDVDNATIVVAPIPDWAYTLKHRFIRSETPLSSDSDTPLLPLEMSEGLILYAVQLAFEFIRDTEKALAAEKQFSKWLRRIEDNNARSREPFRVRVRPGSLF